MRAWEMHPLCCLAGEWPGSGGGLAAGDRSPPPEPAGAEGEAPAVAGVLYKWTNIGKGWRPRWFAIRGGVLAYSKIRRRVAAEPHPAAEAAGGVRLIGVTRGAGGAAERPIGFVHLKKLRRPGPPRCPSLGFRVTSDRNSPTDEHRRNSSLQL
ncbi:oxysterol-binding protein-related protein 1B-like [Panicum miliaceum]|uniref:Oxysterol-binding protein-related protein 1B-like n=1 Tax=Panicum miliaceum TaxID=4540 RepID=A0A3L6TKH8_PANMI|nr:oxysterol-binding protein-related protein 1B-like [Panicum miliaceum]